MQAGAINDSLKPVSWLIGKWKSISAKGQYPTIKPFEYSEEIVFSSIGQPILNYQSNTWNTESLKPMHLETGFLRIKPGTDQIALIVSHNFGVCSVEEGNICGKEIKLKTTGINRIAFAKEPAVTEIERHYTLRDDGRLELVVNMATTETPLCKHLHIIYEIVE